MNRTSENMVLISAALALSHLSCASFQRQDAANTPVTSLPALQHELAAGHSDRLTVSTHLLKELINTERRERVQEKQCRDISGKLEAIRGIDLEGAPQ